jgi:DNA-binding HxlR family transcriptional regulator
MSLRTPLSELNCSLAKALDIVGDPWALLILRDLFMGASRFAELSRSLGVARNILSDRLALLVEKGLVERQGTEHRPTYHLTAMSRDLVPALVALMQWGDRWLADAPPMLIVDGRGRLVQNVVLTMPDGSVITAADLFVRPGPGAHPATRSYIDHIARRPGSETRRPDK